MIWYSMFTEGIVYPCMPMGKPKSIIYMSRSTKTSMRASSKQTTVLQNGSEGLISSTPLRFYAKLEIKIHNSL